MRNTITAGQVRLLINALTEATTTLEQLAQLMRNDAGLLPVGTPLAIGTLRGLIGHARATLLQAAVTDVRIVEAAQ